jgi:hypothetical protein
MLTLVTLIALSQAPVCYKQNGVTRCDYGNRVNHGDRVQRAGGRAGGAAPPFFEFAPVSGAGVGTACACTAVTGSKGETITHTRATSAVCLKTGVARTGLVNGDAVTCGNNLPRVVSDGTGLGLMMEELRTNRIQQSNDISNGAVWLTATSGTSAPVRTAAFATGPDGVANSASRLEVGACAAGGTFSIVAQNYTASASGVAANVSVMIKGTSGSGNLGLYVYDGSSGIQIACAYNNTTWTWCGGPGAAAVYTAPVTGMQIGMGCTNNGIPGASNTGAADVLIWGANAQEGLFPTSPIITTTAVVTRNADVNSINGSTFPVSPFSTSLVWTPLAQSGLGLSNGLFEGQIGSASGVGIFVSAGFLRFQTLAGTAINVQSTPTLVPGTSYKLGGVNSGGSSTQYFNGAISAGPTVTNNAASPWSSTTGIGYAPAGPLWANGIVSRICLDSSITRCVP